MTSKVRFVAMAVIGCASFLSPLSAEDSGEKPAWRATIERRFSENVPRLEFELHPFSEVIEFLRDNYGINMVIDPVLLSERADETLRVSIRVSDLSLKDSISLIAAMVQVSWEIRSGAVIFGTPERIATLPEDLATMPEGAPEGVRDTDAKLRTERMTFSGYEIPWSDYSAYVQETAGIGVELSPEILDGRAAEDIPLTLHAHDTGLGHMLAIAAWTQGGRIEVGEGVVRIVKGEESH